MRPFNIDHLRSLVTIADSGSMASAGRLLHLSPAALSLHVAELERRVGGRLLVRHARGVSLNAAGRGLVDRARRILAQCQEAEEEAKAQVRERSTRWRIATLTFFVLEMLPRLANDPQPQIDPGAIDFVVTEAGSALQMLYSDDVDLAIVTQPRNVPAEDYAVMPLCRLPLAAFAPSSWETPNPVSPVFFAQRPLICPDTSTASHEIAMRWLGRGTDQPAEFTVNFHSAILRLVEEGMGFALLPYTPKLAGGGPISVSQLEGQPSMEVYCVHRRDASGRDLLSPLIDTVTAVGAQLTAA